MSDNNTTRYSETARDYLVAAEILWQKEKHEGIPVVGPCSYCLCHGIELLLKDLLLRKDWKEAKVREFRHNIHQIWMLPEFCSMRDYAQQYALDCVKVKPGPYCDPSQVSVDKTIFLLDKVYGHKSDYALKYPEGKTKVPYPQPLLWVLFELVDDPRWY